MSELLGTTEPNGVRAVPQKQKPRSGRARDWPEAVPRKMGGRKKDG